jgi:hypothetical protein
MLPLQSGTCALHESGWEQGGKRPSQLREGVESDLHEIARGQAPPTRRRPRKASFHGEHTLALALPVQREGRHDASADFRLGA